MIRSFQGKTPKVHPTAWVSEAAYVIGDVEIGPYSSVWPGSVIRADTIKITLGSYVDIQDNCVLHADSDAYYGDYVTLGHGVTCHAKHISSHCLIGNGATLNDGVILGETPSWPAARWFWNARSSRPTLSCWGSRRRRGKSRPTSATTP